MDTTAQLGGMVCDPLPRPRIHRPPCWWKHGHLVEELSALHTAHTAAFDSSDAGFGPIGWHERLSLAMPRLTRAYAGGCGNGHRDINPRSSIGQIDEQEWDAWTSQAHAH